jgi:hypothetical protein
MWSTGSLSCFITAIIILALANGQSTTSPKEQEGIEKLRKLAGPIKPEYLTEDFMLLNFLRAAQLDVNEAHRRLKEAVEWRKTIKIDKIREEKILPELYPWRIEGHDKKGRPIVYWPAARWDARKVILAGQRDAFIRKHAQLVDTAMYAVLDARKATGKDIREFDLILDLHGYNLRQHACLLCFPTYFEWTNNYERNYPQTFGNFYMINTPRIFQPLLELLRGIFTPHTRKALKVYGPNKQEWVPELLKFIDEDVLIQQYGGKKP